MNIDLTKQAAVFSADGRPAGHYVLDDPFKPYLHPLRSPAGHVVTVAMPGDHRHHKGLMYALRCADLNFWEENPGSGHCGVQDIISTDPAGDSGLRQEILWREEGGGLETYREERHLSCTLSADGTCFEWTWRSRREALRDHRLIKSQWSLELPDGRKINYHGLGIRLPWMWAFGGDDCPFNGIETGGRTATAMETCGTAGPEVTWWGLIDGHWAPPKAAVTLRQDHGYGWFVLKGDFAYLTAGPSNLAEREVARGEIFEETFLVSVADR